MRTVSGRVPKQIGGPLPEDVIGDAAAERVELDSAYDVAARQFHGAARVDLFRRQQPQPGALGGTFDQGERLAVDDHAADGGRLQPP
jgi:hypothetical protein